MQEWEFIKENLGARPIIACLRGKETFRWNRNFCGAGSRAWVLQLSGHAAVVIELGPSGCLKEKQKNIWGFL